MGLLSRIGSAIGGAAKKVVSTAKNVVSKATTAVKSTASKAATAVKSAVSKPSSSSSSSSSKSSGGGTLSKVVSAVTKPIVGTVGVLAELIGGQKETTFVDETGTPVKMPADFTGIDPSKETVQEGREGLVQGTVNLIGAALAGASGVISKTITAVSKAAQIGKPAVILSDAMSVNKFPALGVTLSNYATNAKTVSQSAKILKGLGLSTAIAGGVMTVVGTVPFAGFIKEEALQTLDFAINAARDVGDVEGERRALEEKAALLDPTTWDKIVNLIPFANVQKSLKDFYDAATTKLEIDNTSLEMREAETDKWSQINQEQAAQDEADKAYWEQQQADEDARVADERAYWENQQATQDEKDQEERDYFENLETQKRETELGQRAEDAKYFADIEEANKLQKLKEQGDDAAYYAAVAEANRTRELDERAADAKYFDLIRQGNYDAAAAQLAEQRGVAPEKVTPQTQAIMDQAAKQYDTKQQTKAGPSPQGFTGTQEQPKKQGAGPSPQGFTGTTTPYKSNYKSVIGYQAPKPQAPQAPPVQISNYERAGSTVSKPGQAQWVDPNPKPAAPKKPRVATTTSTATSSYKSPTYKPIIRQPDVVTQKMNQQINTGQYTTKPTSVSIGKMKEPIKLNTIKTQAPAKQYQTFTQMKGTPLTTYEKTAIDNWNSGKSSLSFAWLKGGEWY